jgi:hypothetical protein
MIQIHILCTSALSNCRGFRSVPRRLLAAESWHGFDGRVVYFSDKCEDRRGLHFFCEDALDAA